MDTKIIKFLRDSAQECIRIARHCADYETTYAIEDVAFSLMAMAEEIEQTFKQC